jgi:acetolactate synthase-1/2/3 large subunit
VKLSEFLHRRLATAGVMRAFGVPGYFVMPIWQEFSRGAPEIVLARHESGAAYMADGHSRTTRTLGVVLATSGPGMTNCVTGVACAYRDSVPMLVITGQAPTSTFGRGAFLESYLLDRSTSAAALLSPITKKSIEIVDPANGAFLIDTAISLSQSGRPGPVHLSIPIDLQQTEIPDDRPPHVHTTSQGHEQVAFGAAITHVADLLAHAARPLLLAGWGCMLAGAEGELTALAEETGALVVTSTKALSCLPTWHPSRFGHLGPGQRSDTARVINDYAPDVVVITGASLSSYYAEAIAPALDTAALVRIDIDPDSLQLRRMPDVAIHGDARAVLQALRYASRTRQAAKRGRSLADDFQSKARRALAAQPPAYGTHPSVSGTIARLAEMLPADAVVVPDAGSHWLDTISLHQAQRAGGIQLNCGIGAMGWAIGASIGMATASTDRLTVCITGDGSMLMSGGELSVAAEHRLNHLTLVFNNQSHGRVRIGQRMDFDGEPFRTDIPPIDFAQWMAAMGIRSFKIEHPWQVEPTLKDAIKSPGTVGVEILCDPDETPASLRNWIEDGQ